jgi:hypothetical protein
MPVAEIARRFAAGLLLLIGASGVAVGLQLLGAMAGAAGDTRPGIAISAGIAIYGAALVAAGIGVAFRRRWGFGLGLVGIVAGALLLVALLVVARGDAILLGGLLVWAATLACLLLARRLPSR